jgi:hypothetical protein
MTARATGENSNDADTVMCIRCHVFDNGGTPTVELHRNASSENRTVDVYVVEFNSDITVQKLISSMAAGDLTKNVTCTAVDLSRAFVFGTGNGAGAGDDANDYYIRYRFTTTTNVEMYRGTNPVSNAMDNYIYVVEDTAGTHFTVQTADKNATVSGNYDSTISEVDTATTMVLSSFATSSGSQALIESSAMTKLHDSTTVRTTRTTKAPDYSTTTYHHHQIIEWIDGTTVQRGAYNVNSGGSATVTTSAALDPALDTDYSIGRWVNYMPVQTAHTQAGGSEDTEGQILTRIRTGGAFIDMINRSSDGAHHIIAHWEAIQFAAAPA